MANFAVSNSSLVASNSPQVNCGAAYMSLVVTAATTGAFVNAPTYVGLKRGKLYDILVGTNGTPADNYVEYAVARITMACSGVYVGTLSSVSSAFLLDTADPYLASFIMANSSNETGITKNDNPWYVGVNQHASYRWVAAPGSEIVWPAVSSATGNNGLALCARSGAYTSTVTGSVMAQEQ